MLWLLLWDMCVRFRRYGGAVLCSVTSGGGKWLSFPGGMRGFATRSFVNQTLNTELDARVTAQLAKMYVLM